MPYGNITIGADVYAPRNPGVYVLNSVALGGPTKEFRMKPASTSKNGNSTFSIVYIFDKDTGTSPDLIRDRSIITLSCQTTNSGRVSAVNLDDAISAINTFAVSDTITRLMQGEA